MRAALLRARDIVAQLAEHLDVTGEALARGDAGNLETYLSHELALLGKLDETFQQQHALLARQGLSADRQGMEAAIRRCGDSELDAVWLELRTRLANCYEKLGRLDRAKEEYEAALERMPGFPDAQAGLQRIKRPDKPERGAGGGWLESLLSRFTGSGGSGS